MMKEEAIVHTLFIKQVGQRVHFQMLLPHDTNRIVGLEYGAIKTGGVQLPDAVPYSAGVFRMVANKIIGRLTLQVPGMEGIFCQQDCIEDRNMATTALPGAIKGVPAIYTHERKNEELALDVNGNVAFIEGYYVDSWGTSEYQSLEYTLHLYLWIEKTVL